MTESLRDIRDMLGPLAVMAEPTDRDRRVVARPEPPKPHPCEKCGEETLYSPDDAVNLHTRAPIDEWDNRYSCRSDYHPKHRLMVSCGNCEMLYEGVVPVAQDRLPAFTCRMCGAKVGE